MSLRGARRRGNLGEFRIQNSEFKNLVITFLQITVCAKHL